MAASKTSLSSSLLWLKTAIILKDERAVEKKIRLEFDWMDYRIGISVIEGELSVNVEKDRQHGEERPSLDDVAGKYLLQMPPYVPDYIGRKLAKHHQFCSLNFGALQTFFEELRSAPSPQGQTVGPKLLHKQAGLQDILTHNSEILGTGRQQKRYLHNGEILCDPQGALQTHV
eukprot:jgi/Psemu1/5640/gm1.5640_g